MRILSKKEARALTSLSIAHMARLGHEGKFPRLIKLGDYRNSRAGYNEQEVLDWIHARVRLRDETPPGQGGQNGIPLSV